MLNDNDNIPTLNKDDTTHNTQTEIIPPANANIRIPDTTNIKQIGCYSLGAELGSGAFGKVVWAEHILTGEKVAIKILDKIMLAETPEDFELVKQEIANWKLVKHSNIAQLYEILETPQHIFLVTELCEGKDLMDYILTKTKLSEEESLKFFQQWINALIYLHSQNIAHRDIKIDNWWLDRNKNLKWVDFGLSTIYKDDTWLNQPCGTIVYAAPEVLDGKEYHGMLADVWSSGIVLYGMIAGYLPFCDPDDEVNKKSVMEGEIDLPPDEFNELERDIILHLLDRDPMTRYTLDEIESHPWFQQREFIAIPGIIIGFNIIPIDERIMNMVEEYGKDKDKVRSDLKRNKFNNGTALYYILVQKVKNDGYSSVSDWCSEDFIKYITDDENMIKVDRDDLGEKKQNEIENVKEKENVDVIREKEENCNSTTVNNTSVFNNNNNNNSGNEINDTREPSKKEGKIIKTSSTSINNNEDNDVSNNQKEAKKENANEKATFEENVWNKNGENNKQNSRSITPNIDFIGNQIRTPCKHVEENDKSDKENTKWSKVPNNKKYKHLNKLSKSVEYNSNNKNSGTTFNYRPDFYIHTEIKRAVHFNLNTKKKKSHSLSSTFSNTKPTQKQTISKPLNKSSNDTATNSTWSLKIKTSIMNPNKNQTSSNKIDVKHIKKVSIMKEPQSSWNPIHTESRHNKHNNKLLTSYLNTSTLIEEKTLIMKKAKNKIIRNVDNSVINYRNKSPIAIRDFSYSPNHTGLLDGKTRMERLPWKYKKQGLDNKLQDNWIYENYKVKVKKQGKKTWIKHKEQSNMNNKTNIKTIRDLQLILRSNTKKICQIYSNIPSPTKPKKQNTNKKNRQNSQVNSKSVKSNSMECLESLLMKTENEFFNDKYQKILSKKTQKQSGGINSSVKSKYSLISKVAGNRNGVNINLMNVSTSSFNCFDKNGIRFDESTTNKKDNNPNCLPGFYEGPIDFLCISKYSSMTESISSIKKKMKNYSIFYVQTKPNRFRCTKNGQSVDLEIVKLNLCFDSNVLLYYRIICKQGDITSYRAFAKIFID